MNQDNTKKRGSGLFLSLSAVMAVPILVLGIIFIALGTQSVSEGMELEIKKALASTARETVALYSLSYPGDRDRRTAFSDGRRRSERRLYADRSDKRKYRK